jgi:hypothetical protein
VRALPGNLSRAGVAGGPSTLASPACPMLVLPARLLRGAPPSARLLAWASAASAAENFGAALAVRALEEGGAAWEGALGLRTVLDGEVAWEEEGGGGSSGAAPTVQLQGWAGVRYDEDVLRRGPWWDAFNDPRHCGAVFELPQEGRAWDALWLTKGAAARKYALARAAAPPGSEPLLWEGSASAPGDIHIAVHARRVHLDAAELGPGFAPPESHELWDDPRAAWSRAPRTSSNSSSSSSSSLGEEEGWLYYPTKDAVLAKVVRDTVLPAFEAAQAEAAAAEAAAEEAAEGGQKLPPPRLRLHVHVFSQLLPSEAGEEVFPALAALPVHAVRFHGPQRADGWAAFHHLARADVLVGSASQWSLWAAHFSYAPLVLAQADGDKLRLCGEGQACCARSGECPYPARARAQASAARLLAREQCRLARAAAEEAGAE